MNKLRDWYYFHLVRDEGPIGRFLRFTNKEYRSG